MIAEVFIGLDVRKREQFVLNRCSPLNMGKADLIKAMVCNFMQKNPSDLEGASRKREFVTVRQMCMYFISWKTELTLKQIGAMFGNRDHSTVIYAKETINDLMDTDRLFKKLMVNLDKLLEAELKSQFLGTNEADDAD